MPGVMRPYTLVDLLGVINGQSQSSSDTTTGASATGFGIVAEADEQLPSTTVVDAASTILATTAPGWDQAVWGGFAWQ